MSNPFNIAATVVVITGASRGIGLAIARHFLLAGASVVVGGADPVETNAAVDELSRCFGDDRILGLAGDISNAGTAKSLIDLAFQRFGRLDTVVCNAGIDIIKPATDYDATEWDRVLSVNLRGAFLTAQQAARIWIMRGSQGNVIFTSSIIARAGVAGLAAYGASKGGIDQLVRSLAVEWAQHGIRVNAIAPGYVDNGMAGVEVHSDPASDRRIKAFTPMNRRATVDEIAAPSSFSPRPLRVISREPYWRWMAATRRSNGIGIQHSRDRLSRCHVHRHPDPVYGKRRTKPTKLVETMPGCGSEQASCVISTPSLDVRDTPRCRR